MKRCFFLLLLLGVLMGCATQRPLYYWGNYSSSLYNYKKAPTEENLNAHKAVLLKIIDESNKLNLRVPPGVCCEYGYVLLKEGKEEEAMRYFELEEKTYPESKPFLDRFRAKWIEKKGN
jgi:hypothetical protein